MKILVTGCAGFIGSHLTEALVDLGHDVTGLDDLSNGSYENMKSFFDNIDFSSVDIARNESAWKSSFENVDCVFHLAALADIVPSVQDPETYFAANVLGTLNVIEACRHYNVPQLRYAASGSCYGIPSVQPTPESAEIKPEYPYALTKRLGEELVLHWGKVYGLDVKSLRLFNVYGPRSRTSGTYGAMFGVFLAQRLAGKPLTVVGDGTQSRDFTYVSDVVAAFLSTMAPNRDVPKVDFYNVGSGETVTVNEIVELLGCETVHIPKRPGEPDVTHADISKIRKAYGWGPKIDITTGVQQLLECISYWEDAPVWTPETIDIATKDWFRFLGRQS